MDLNFRERMGEVTPPLMELIFRNYKSAETEAPGGLILEGSRNDTIFKKGRKLLAAGLDEGEITALLMNFNATQCRPPLAESEVRRIAQSIMNYDNNLPTIVTIHMQQRDVTDLAIACLVEANRRELTIFQFGSELVRIRQTGCPQLERLDQAALAWHLAREANWKNPGNKNAGPPSEIVKAILGAPSWPFPAIKGIIKTPIFSTQSKLSTQVGYNPETQYWYHDELPEAIGEVSPNPCSEEIAACRNFLIQNLLGDFPFKDEASLAHTVAALILPFVRIMIDGATPLHLFDASTPGTGKSLLAGLISLIVLGTDAPMMTEAHGEEEWRKRITATLMQAPILTLIDNVGQKLDSPALSSAITSTVWKDRILGKSKTISLPVETMWLATGNNVEVSNEISRRVVWIRLVPDSERPWERTDFSQPNIRQWVKKQRPELIRAILTLIQGWIAAGSPAGGKSLGNFESWAEVVGGILSFSGIPGFLDNAKDFYAKADADMDAWRAFVALWWDAFGEQATAVRSLYQIPGVQDIFESLFAARPPSTHTSVFGKALTALVDRKIAGYFIRNDRRNRNGSKLYRLEPESP